MIQRITVSPQHSFPPSGSGSRNEELTAKNVQRGLAAKIQELSAAFRKKHLGNHGVAEAVTLAILTAMIGYFNRFLRIDMTESLELLFHECDSVGDVDNLCQ